MAVAVKKRPKVRWLFVINPRERKKERRKEPQEKADGKKERGGRRQAHILRSISLPRLEFDIKLGDLFL